MRKCISIFLVAAACAALAAEDISFGFRPMPPYVMIDKDGHYSGLEYEIIEAALRIKGHTLKPSDYPLARLVATIKNKAVRGAAPILPSHDTGAFLSEPYITYNNVAMALARNKYNLQSPSDLKGKSVIAFQTAKNVLGPEFAKAMEGDTKYREDALQVVQIRLLFAGRVDVAIGESRILNWFIRSKETEVDHSIPVSEFRIFKPTNYCAAFTDARLAEDFNEGLKTIMSNGTYDRIMAKYSN